MLDVLDRQVFHAGHRRGQHVFADKKSSRSEADPMFFEAGAAASGPHVARGPSQKLPSYFLLNDHPINYPFEVDRCGGDQMLKMGLGLPSIPCSAHAQGKSRLRDRPLNP